MDIKTHLTYPFSDQNPGTSGLRKRCTIFEQANYVENYIQSIFTYIKQNYDLNETEFTLILGGDGRYMCDTVAQKVIQMAAANGVFKLKIYHYFLR